MVESRGRAADGVFRGYTGICGLHLSLPYSALLQSDTLLSSDGKAVGTALPVSAWLVMELLTVFLSSTCRDLGPFRDAAYRAIEGLQGYHCVRMEDFGARDWDADEFCRARIAECDVFVCLIGHLYGSRPPGGSTSYTEREYDVAVKTGLPRLLFVAHDDLPVCADLREPEELWCRQERFRKRAQQDRIAGMFAAPDQLAAQVVTALRNLEVDARSARQETHAAQQVSPQEAPVEVLTPRRTLRVLGQGYVFVPGGTFLMGSDDGYLHERPRHPVRLSPFFLGDSPVTNRRFQLFVEQTLHATTAEVHGFGICPCGDSWRPTEGADFRHPFGPGSSVDAKPNHPVVQVSWYDANAYCKWLSRQTGFSFGLPTEAEWEYSAAGGRARRWAFGDVYSAAKANLEGTDTSAVGRFPPNELGCYDMTGNVYEWCSDWYSESWSAAGHRLEGSPTFDPSGSVVGARRVVRGGSWFDGEDDSRCANRFAAEPGLSSANWGFRCCLRVTDALLAALLGCHEWGMTAREMFSGTEGTPCTIRTSSRK